MIAGISSVRSRKEKSGYCEWFESTAVGSGQTLKPMVERIGITVMRDVRPMPERS